MNRNAVAPTIVACVLILAVAGLVVALKLRSDRDASGPTAPATITITATGSATPSATPVSTPTPSAPAALPLSDYTVCITPNVSCSASEMHSEPTQVVLSGDGSTFVGGLTWTGWGSSGATGSGTLKVDNCEPNCAQGKLTPYQATITLSDLTSYSGSKQGYADMTVTAAGSPYGTHSYSNLLP
jgi:hypothetical protein